MTINLGNILQIALILLVLVLAVAAIQFIIVLFDVRSITRRLKKEIKAATFFIDFIDIILGGLELAKNKITKSKFFSRAQKAVEILKEGGEEDNG